VCKAVDDFKLKEQVIGAIQGMRIAGLADNDIIANIIENFGVTKEYVIKLLIPQKV
jgi:hypothetical protein